MQSSPDNTPKAINSKPFKTAKRKQSKASVKVHPKISTTNGTTKTKDRKLGALKYESDEIEEKSIQQTSDIQSDSDSDDNDEVKSDKKITNVSDETSSVSSDTSSGKGKDDITRKRADIGSKKKSKLSLLAEAVSDKINLDPPKGFLPYKFQEKNGSSLLLNESNLEGKEVWYITVPSELDISSIENISKTALENGTPVTKINGDEYGFCVDSSEIRNYKIITPEVKKDGYRVVSRPVCKLVNLQQVVMEASKLKNKPEKINSMIGQLKSGRKRQQPKGLRMRFHPLGSSTNKIEKIGDDSNSDQSCDETAKDEVEKFKPPTLISISKKRKKKVSFGNLDSPSSGRKVAILSKSESGTSTI